MDSRFFDFFICKSLALAVPQLHRVWLLASLLLFFWPVLGCVAVWLLACLVCVVVWLGVLSLLSLSWGVAASVTSVPFGLSWVCVAVWLLASFHYISLLACPGCV